MNAIEWLNELEAKADAATPGPWRVVNDDKHRDVCAVCAEKPMFIPFSGRNDKSNAHFIAAANPETVKRLVGMVRDGRRNPVEPVLADRWDDVFTDPVLKLYGLGKV